MRILSAKQTRAADAYTIHQEPISSIDLMERASGVFAHWFTMQFDKDRTIYLFAGMGNNGGDGLAVARMLHQKGFRVLIYKVRYSDNPSADFLENEERLDLLQKIVVSDILESDPFPEIPQGAYVIDALFGSGLSRPIEGWVAQLIHYLNNTRSTRVAIDIPSGTYADKHSDGISFHAEHTLTFELPKLAFMLPENHIATGEWTCKSIGLDRRFIEDQETDYHYLADHDVAPLLKERSKFSHKGIFGHALIVAGSYGSIGAAAMSGKACLRVGAALLNMHIPACGYTTMQTLLPEAMCSTSDEKILTDLPEKADRFSTIAIGPGIGQEAATMAMLEKALEFRKPLVIDADALNILSKHPEWMNNIPKLSVLTPHPKEFERLFGKTDNHFDRLDLLQRKARELQLVIVLKGAHSAIALPDGNVWFNSTGNPGMATAGSGDVLTGMITGLLAQGYASDEAAKLGVWLHGKAGDLAADKLGQESMLATDIIDNIAFAYKRIYELRSSPAS